MVYENFRFIYGPDYELSKSLGTKAEKIGAVANPAQEATQQAIPSPSGQSRSQQANSTTASLATSVTKDVSMNRMVDALVDDDYGLDVLPEDGRLLPTTPPTTYDNPPMVRSPSNRSIALPVSDLVQQIQNWGQPKDAATQ